MTEYINVKITSAENASRLKVVWSRGGREFRPYLLDIDMVRRTANEHVRPALTELVRAMRAQDRTRIADALRETAVAGRRLHDVLFYAEAGSAQDPASVQKWLAKMDDVRIGFTVDPRIHVPWGLVFDSDPDAIPAGAIDSQHYDSFWCLKYEVSTVYSFLEPLGLQSPADPEAFSLAAAVDEQVLGRILDKIGADDQEAWQSVKSAARAFFTSSSDLIQQWNQNSDTIALLYFLCHASGTELRLTNDQLSIDDFKLKLRRQSSVDRPPCLVILNGCLTATGSETGGFLEATGASGYCGFIGTETKIPDVFAFRFGRDLVARMLFNGETAAEALAQLRKAHWPLSLVYQLYGDPALQVKVPESRFTPTNANYSDGPLGTHDI
ncbi:MAG TPA: CHAT domain-containing protein [Thermoanaerobaculia bacterium]|nr:CHAT domain-containing protein [Thermoanaerobaculia bacterium]